MPKRLILTCSPLLVSLFIYLGFRTDKTIVNQLFIYLFSVDMFHQIQFYLQSWIPLSGSFIYSLPEALWLFSVVLVAKNFHFNVLGKKIPSALVPLIYALVLEIMQGVHLTKGRFDWMDIEFALIAFAVAMTFKNSPSRSVHLFHSGSRPIILFVGSFILVVLSVVWH